MKRFIWLQDRLDQAKSSNDKVMAMVEYFRQATPEDAAWAIFFLNGRKIKRIVSSRLLILWFLEAVGLSEWLFEECQHTVGDIAETIALLNDTFNSKQPQDKRLDSDIHLSTWMTQYILPLEDKEPEFQRKTVTHLWKMLETSQVFLLNKLLTGTFRMNVSQKLLVQALSEVSGLESTVLTARLIEQGEPTGLFYQQLMTEEFARTNISKPYPFFLASPLEQLPEDLGQRFDWQIEWQWEGIRAQSIYRNQQAFLWSKDNDLLSEKFPELNAATALLPSGTVLDGVILAHDGKQPLPISVLQTRINRKIGSKKALNEAPVVFMAYDILEYQERDVRQEPLYSRRQMLESILQNAACPLLLSPTLTASSWSEVDRLREKSRTWGTGGCVLKRVNSTYQSGRKQGDWWKWKRDPFTIEAVLLYAQAGIGERPPLYTDYTFAVWHEDTLIPIAKTHVGLSNAEVAQLDEWVRENTVERFGPVRAVKPEHVFELAFEGISESKRHKSGVTIRSPKILHWKTDKPIENAHTLDDLHQFLYSPGSHQQQILIP